MPVRSMTLTNFGTMQYISRLFQMPVRSMTLTNVTGEYINDLCFRCLSDQ